MNICIVQARLNSQRLEKKMFLNIHGRYLIDWVHYRISKIKNIDKLVFAIPFNQNNDYLYEYLKNKGLNIHRGSETNVLKRFYSYLIKYSNLKPNLIRICADRPLISHQEVDKLINFFNKNEFDYAYNHIPHKNNYPIGFGAEICSYDCFLRVYSKAKIKSQQEHMFNYIWDNQKDFKIGTINTSKKIGFPKFKFDVDTIKDLKYLNRVKFKINVTPVKLIKLFKGIKR